MKVVFLGPSLSRSEAKQVLDADYRPPARQGDVFRAIEAGATCIGLIDGVFESAPSVWHHELIAAQHSGIPVFGAASMGALRAAELPGVVRPVGEIAHRYASGEWNDDAWVALLHGDAASGYRALTVPQVNVWATARAAVKQRVLTQREADRLCSVSEAIFYQSRTWPTVLEAFGSEAMRSFKPVDLKAADARACLEAVSDCDLTWDSAPTRLSSFVRRMRLPANTQPVNDAEGTRLLLLAEFAKISGIQADPDRIAWWAGRLQAKAPDVREAWAEALALDELILQAPERFVSDGPSREEGAALMAALRGAAGHYRER